MRLLNEPPLCVIPCISYKTQSEAFIGRLLRLIPSNGTLERLWKTHFLPILKVGEREGRLHDLCVWISPAGLAGPEEVSHGQYSTVREL